MGDQTGSQGVKSPDDWKRKLADRLLEIDNLPEDTIRMFLKGQITQRVDTANLEQYMVKDLKTGQPVIDPATGQPVKESYHSFNPEQYLAQCNLTPDEIDSFKTNHPKAFEAYRRWVSAAFRLEIGTDLGMVGTLQSDSPPHMHKLAAKIMELTTRPLTEEVRIAQQVERRTAAFEYAYRDLQREFTEILKASSVPDVIRLGNLLQAAYKRIEVQDTQITSIRHDAVEFTDKLKAELGMARGETDKKEATIVALNGLLGDLTSEKEGLEKKLVDATKARKEKTEESAKHLAWYNDREALVVNQKSQILFALEQNGKLATANQDLEKKLVRARAGKWTGWLAATGASILAVGLLVYRPSQPTIPVENVPQEVITYSKERVTVSFGDVKYEMSADRFTQIYKELGNEQQKADRHFTPSERKKYFDSTADKKRYIKDIPKDK